MVEKAKYRLDLGDERLWHGDQPVEISNKAFQLLRLLVSNPNRLLTKDHILDAVWGGRNPTPTRTSCSASSIACVRRACRNDRFGSIVPVCG